MAKSLRKIAKQLIGQAYRREQEKALDSLRREFDRWRSGEIDCWELTELIHRFHNGESRGLYKIYEMGDIKIALARAMGVGILAEDEVPADLREPMRPMIEFFRGELDGEDHYSGEEKK